MGDLAVTEYACWMANKKKIESTSFHFHSILDN